MCLVIDINALPSVFESASRDHKDFKPILDWILDGKGKIIYGGSKYLQELSQTKYLRFFLELKKIEKAKFIDNRKVDNAALKVSQIIQNRQFNDQHLVGLLISSKCKIICSKDVRAYPYFRHQLFFTSSNRPRIYSQSANRNLLNDSNIVDVCLPCSKMTKNQKKSLAVKP